MPCKSWNAEWVAHLYGELDAIEHDRLTEHLGRCSECRETLEQLESSRRMLGELAPAELAAPRVVLLPQRRLRRPARPIPRASPTCGSAASPTTTRGCTGRGASSSSVIVR